jgi:hypothetical protein
VDDREIALWVFDEAIANYTEILYAQARCKQRQYLGFMQDGLAVLPGKSTAVFNLGLTPGAGWYNIYRSCLFCGLLWAGAVFGPYINFGGDQPDNRASRKN